MPKREEQTTEMKVVKKSPLWEKCKKLLELSGVLDKVEEHEMRKVKVQDGDKLNIMFVTFTDGKTSIKEVLYYFFASKDVKEFDYYFLEVNGDEEILIFYKDDR